MDEEWGGGKASDGSMEGERRGLGGAGRTLDPTGGAAGGWGEERQAGGGRRGRRGAG